MGSLALYNGTPVLIPIIEPSVLSNSSIVGFDVGTLVVPLYFRIVGDTVEAEGRFTTGTTQAVNAVLSLPNSWTAATPGGNVLAKGRWTRINANSATNRKTGPLIFTNGSGSVLFGSDEYATANAPATPLNGNLVAGNGEVIELTFSIPITSLVALGSYRAVGAGISATLPSLVNRRINVTKITPLSGATTSPNITVKQVRVDEIVTLTFSPTGVVTKNGVAGPLSVAIDADFRPTAITGFINYGLINSIYGPYFYRITPPGNLEMYSVTQTNIPANQAGVGWDGDISFSFSIR